MGPEVQETTRPDTFPLTVPALSPVQPTLRRQALESTRSRAPPISTYDAATSASKQASKLSTNFLFPTFNRFPKDDAGRLGELRTKRLIPPALPDQIDGVEHEDIQQFLESVADLKAALTSDSRSRQKSQARDALRHLYRLNLGNKRIPLYKHYMRNIEDSLLPEVVQGDIGPGVIFQKDLEEYSKATAQYESFMNGHGSGWTIQSDSHLIEVAARLAVVEAFTKKQTEDQAKHAAYQQIIDIARLRLATYYTTQILDMDPNLVRIAARDSYPEEAKKKAKQEREDEDRKNLKKKAEKESKRFFSNLKMALFGGCALIVPMLIMTLHQTQLTTLLTTSIFVLAVAIILSAVNTAEKEDIVGATAAYAAVLVVFVGTGAGSSSPASGGHVPNGSGPTHGHNELSGGAIAGIVVGCVVGVFLLLLTCLCCCAKGILDAFLGLFGLGPRARRRTEETVVYEQRRYPVRRESGRTWFGAKPSRAKGMRRRNSRLGTDTDETSSDDSFSNGESSHSGVGRRRYYV